MMRGILSSSAALFLAGCMMGPQHSVPDVPLPLSLAVPNGENTGEGWQFWWEQFDDPVLDRLVADALRDNLDLQQQAARVRAARAQLGFERFQQWPRLSVEGAANRDQQPASAFGFPGASANTQSSFSITAILGYEVDLWGRLARAEEVAAGQLAQSVYDREALRLTVVVEVVNTYFAYRAQQQAVRTTEQAIATRDRAAELQQIRYDAGMVDRLTLLQAQSDWVAARAQLPDQRERLGQLESALAILLGYGPKQLFETMDFGDVALADLQRIETLPPVLPSEMLKRRPDIRAAEQALRAANAAIGQAMAERMPQLNLSALIGTVATEAGDLFTSNAEAWGVGASVLGTHTNRSGVRAAEAQRDLAELRYLATVQVAFAEVRDALLAFETSRERVETVQRQVELLADTTSLAEIRYEGGASIFLEVLDARRASLEAQLALSQSEQQRLASAATLFKVLGGGWDPDAVDLEGGDVDATTAPAEGRSTTR